MNCFIFRFVRVALVAVVGCWLRARVHFCLRNFRGARGCAGEKMTHSIKSKQGSSVFISHLRDLALSRTVCTFFEAYWQDKFSKNMLPLRVGNDVATINGVMGVIEILSSRREYTKLNPFVVLLGKGNHEIISSSADEDGDEVENTLEITRSNIVCVGNGKDTTTLLGGVWIANQENVSFRNMTVTNFVQVLMVILVYV